MNIVHIPKKRKGEFRTIYIPDMMEKAVYHSLLPTLQRKAIALCDPTVVHGFMPCKSPITNAGMHISFRFTLSMDLSNFFDSVTRSHLRGKLTEEEIDSVLVNGAPRQGLPTSPTVANIAAIGLDRRVMDLIGKLSQQEKGSRIVYTRYADDLAFSFNSYTIYKILLAEIPVIVRQSNFALNFGKTRLQDSRFGRRIITGVSIGEYANDISAPREIRRKIRAAEHQGKKEQLKGLLAWAMMKLPYKPIQHTIKVLKGIFQLRRAKHAHQNHSLINTWQPQIEFLEAAQKLEKGWDKTSLSAYIKDGFAKGLFTKEDIKQLDRIVSLALPQV